MERRSPPSPTPCSWSQSWPFSRKCQMPKPQGYLSQCHSASPGSVVSFRGFSLAPGGGAGARPVEFSGCRCVVFLREFMEPRCPVELTSLPPPSTPTLTCLSHRLASRTPGELDGAPCTPRKRANLPTACPRPPLQTNTAFPSPGPPRGLSRAHSSSPHCPPAVLYYASHSASGPPFSSEARAGCGGVSWGPAPV